MGRRCALFKIRFRVISLGACNFCYGMWQFSPSCHFSRRLREKFRGPRKIESPHFQRVPGENQRDTKRAAPPLDRPSNRATGSCTIARPEDFLANAAAFFAGSAVFLPAIPKPLKAGGDVCCAFSHQPGSSFVSHAIRSGCFL